MISEARITTSKSQSSADREAKIAKVKADIDKREAEKAKRAAERKPSGAAADPSTQFKKKPKPSYIKSKIDLQKKKIDKFKDKVKKEPVKTAVQTTKKVAPAAGKAVRGVLRLAKATTGGLSKMYSSNRSLSSHYDWRDDLGFIDEIAAKPDKKDNDKIDPKNVKNKITINPDVKTEDKDPCWDTHKQVGMKKKGGKMVPNCVPKEEMGNIAHTKSKKGGKTIINVNKNDEADAQKAMKNDPKYILGKTRVQSYKEDFYRKKFDIKKGGYKKTTKMDKSNKRSGDSKAQYRELHKDLAKEQIKKDKYGDPIGGPKISKKEKKKNLSTYEGDKMTEGTWLKEYTEKKMERTMRDKIHPNTLVGTGGYKKNVQKMTPQEEMSAEFGDGRIKVFDLLKPAPMRGMAEMFKIDPEKHKKAQKTAKMINLARGNKNPNEKAAALKKAKQPKMMGEKMMDKIVSDYLSELNRYEKEKGIDTKTNKKIEKGGTAKNNLALQSVMKKYGSQRMGANQPKKVKGAKSTVGTGKMTQMMMKKKDQAASSKAFADRAKKAGYKSTQDYANVVSRYGSEKNMKQGRGLGS